ncbi:hypothetical protein LOAG_05777 [Loa loa]|uniref:Uncharacterized protein n=1 Tax=Loa loa TaxID=7209 RepID=A0A1S0TZS8_LOALO|nr:hypothetical protein LOAG_05777 [Loa loa]EFO22709.1 hypothetical protein LOAG_05777 [Loa loa]
MSNVVGSLFFILLSSLICRTKTVIAEFYSLSSSYYQPRRQKFPTFVTVEENRRQYFVFGSKWRFNFDGLKVSLPEDSGVYNSQTVVPFSENKTMEQRLEELRHAVGLPEWKLHSK